MLYGIFTPSPELANIVSCYWCVPIGSNTASKQQYVTPLFEGMVFNFTNLKEYRHYEGQTDFMTKMAYIVGQTRSPSIISGTHEDGGFLIGVKFKPLGLAKITGVNMAYIANATIEAEDVWGNELVWLCEAMQEANSTRVAIKLLEVFLKKKLKTTHLNNRVQQVAGALFLMQRLKGNITCKELENLTNTSKKTLERIFVHFHGFKPKLYSQIIRFNTVRQLISQNNRPNFAQLVGSLGYFDQSHFIKDFKRFSGQTPSEYFATLEVRRKDRGMPID